jgi:hypothetical protein
MVSSLVPLLAKSRYRACDSSTASVSSALTNSPTTAANGGIGSGGDNQSEPPSGGSPATTCSDYDACLKVATKAMESANFTSAITTLETAVKLRPDGDDVGGARVYEGIP